MFTIVASSFTSTFIGTSKRSSDSSSKPLRKPTSKKGPYSYYSIA